ncbi:MAG TPA: LytTR family DNA-binding domain-containing protein, partial [Solirubrobacter sp.]
EALARIGERPPAEEPDTLAVDVAGGGTRLVRRDDVLYLQSHGDYVRVVTPDGRFLVRGTLGEIERRWEPHGFHRVHRRFLVNLRRTVEVRPQLNGTALLLLADGAELPIARREVAELRRRLRT